MAQSAWAATLLLGALIDSTTSAAAGKLSLVTWNLIDFDFGADPGVQSSEIRDLIRRINADIVVLEGVKELNAYTTISSELHDIYPFPHKTDWFDVVLARTQFPVTAGLNAGLRFAVEITGVTTPVMIFTTKFSDSEAIDAENLVAEAATFGRPSKSPGIILGSVGAPWDSDYSDYPRFEDGGWSSSTTSVGCTYKCGERVDASVHDVVLLPLDRASPLYSYTAECKTIGTAERRGIYCSVDIVDVTAVCCKAPCAPRSEGKLNLCRHPQVSSGHVLCLPRIPDDIARNVSRPNCDKGLVDCLGISCGAYHTDGGAIIIPIDSIDFDCTKPALSVTFTSMDGISGFDAQCGVTTQSEDNPTLTNPPIVTLGTADTSATYTIMMIDPDAGEISPVRHWLVIGLSGSDLKNGRISDGQVLSRYNRPRPQRGTGNHRYGVFVFKQPSSDLDFEIDPIHTKWNFTQFIAEYGLIKVASNYIVVGGDADLSNDKKDRGKNNSNSSNSSISIVATIAGCTLLGFAIMATRRIQKAWREKTQREASLYEGLAKHYKNESYNDAYDEDEVIRGRRHPAMDAQRKRKTVALAGLISHSTDA